MAGAIFQVLNREQDTPEFPFMLILRITFILTFYKKQNLIIEKHNVLKNSENEDLFGFNFIENNLDKAITENSDRVLIERLLDLLQDAKAEEIVLIDTHEQSSLADYLLICEGRSQLHCRGIAENIEYKLKQEGELSLGMEGEREGNWVLLDYGNIILHIFHPEIRRYYRLEELYEQHPDEKIT